MRPLIVIPARLAATRLPNKPLALIEGEPMIVHVWRRAVEADVAPVIVAAGDVEIVEAVKAAGGEAVLTDPALPSGTDRVHAAAAIVDRDRSYDVVINVQGDLPLVEPVTIGASLVPLADPSIAIGTVAALLDPPEDKAKDSVVKIAVSPIPKGGFGRALYFTRGLAPYGAGPDYHHIGIYAFRRGALDRFVTLPPSALELRERLEQLRAMEDGMQIGVALVETVPASVDTPDDLDLVRRMAKARGGARG